MTKFIKIRFSSKSHGPTAGLIFEASRVKAMSLGDISRAWPYSEALKMERVERSPEYDSWGEAFNHDFKENDDD